MTEHSITTTTTKYVGPDAEECEVPICVTASITPPDFSVGIDNYGWEDVVVTDADGGEIDVSEAESDRLGELVVEAYIKDEFEQPRGTPSEFYS